MSYSALFVIAILVTLLIFIAIVYVWWRYLVVRPLRPWALSIALQLSAFFAITFIFVDLWTALIYAAAPPLGIISIVSNSVNFGESFATSFTTVPLLASTVASLAFYFTVYLLSNKRLILHVFPSMIFGFLVFVYVADHRAQIEMAAKAEILGAVCFRSDRFWNSMRFAGKEFQWNLHAEAITRDGGRFGWSYRTRDFYELSDNISAGVAGGLQNCPVKWSEN